MKKILLVLTLVLLIQGISLFAQFPQTQREFIESEFYFHNVSVEQVFIHRLGYVVVYQMPSSTFTARAYLPHRWFTEASGPGEIIYLGAGNEWPSMTVYYRDGQFSHVRLRLRRDRMHPTWGVVPFGADIDDRFENADRVVLQH